MNLLPITLNPSRRAEIEAKLCEALRERNYQRGLLVSATRRYRMRGWNNSDYSYSGRACVQGNLDFYVVKCRAVALYSRVLEMMEPAHAPEV